MPKKKPVKLGECDLSGIVIILTGATDGKYIFSKIKQMFNMILIIFILKASVKKWREFYLNLIQND
jgi:hypothetical protein